MKANKLYSSGIRTIEQLRKKKTELLTTNQIIGLKHYEDLLLKMDRSEAKVIFETVQKVAKKIFGAKIEVVACGSYRRGKPMCGDVDILITRKDDKPVKGMLTTLVDMLTGQGFMTDTLSLSGMSPGSHSDKNKEMFMGVCKV